MPAKIVGLTGGIGSGKSTVAAILEDLGAKVIHADIVGHETYQPHSEGWQRIIEVFGTQILGPDQTIDRKRLGAIVFASSQALARLNAIVHPLIFAEIRKRIDSHRASGASQPIVVEAAVLIEANWLPLVDEVWLVLASQDAVVDRLAKQRGLPPQEVTMRIAAQLSDAERQRHAHVIIRNTGSIEDLRSQIRTLWERIAGVN
ncbi:MAG: dephospho-CoA kinase [Candidatus Binatia bacterium]